MAQSLQEPTIADLAARHAGPDPDRDLAARHAPILLFDAQEPFLPLVVGYTVFRETARSASAHRYVTLGSQTSPRVATAIEYAIWWDWDIGHLYELEHLWVYLDSSGQVVHAEGSRHGRYRQMLADGAPPLTGGRLTVFSEAGKHGFAPVRGWLERLAPVTRKLCTRHAGLQGVFIPWLFRGIIDAKTPEADRLVHTYLERYAFEPTLDFARPYPIPPESLVPWRDLFNWIPARVTWWVARLRDAIPPGERRFLRLAERSVAKAPENTLATIAQAAALGADGVKLEVQSSADGVPVLFHGPDLGRTTNGHGPVAQHTLQQLKQLDAGDGQTIPTLEEAIACCREHHLGLYLELESEAAILPVVTALRQHRLHERAGVSARNPGWLARVRALDPGLVTAMVVGWPDPQAIGLARSVGARYLHATWEAQSPALRHLVPEWVQAARTAGLGVICGARGDLCELAAVRQLGVDGISSDALHLLLPRAG